MSDLSLTRFKSCTKCGVIKPATSNFFSPRNEYKPPRLRNDCRVCVNLKKTAHYHRTKVLKGRVPNYIYGADNETIVAKRCTRCDEVKPLAAFGKRSDTQHIYRSHCDACLRDYRAITRESVLRSQREYYQIKENRERRKEYLKQWRADNPEVARACNARHYEENREQYYLANRRRRARIAGGNGSHTSEDVKQKHEEQRGKCYWCHEPLNGTWHVDHIIPISKGGGNGPGNICCACPPCNLSKHNKMPWEFSDRLF